MTVKKEETVYPLRRERRSSIDAIVIAHCLDYSRRCDELLRRTMPRRVLMEYRYLNSRIITAAREVVGTQAEIYVRDIGMQIGYAKSDAASVSESVYKTRKKEVKRRIAQKLNLIG